MITLTDMFCGCGFHFSLVLWKQLSTKHVEKSEPQAAATDNHKP
jgi:hypothetical protein